jgi:hypothetical protein
MVRWVLTAIADDEAKHAELAWRTVAWAIAKGGERVRAAAVEAFARSIREAGPIERGDGAALGRWGRLGGRALVAARRRALDEIVLPCTRALGSAATRGAVSRRAAGA